MRNRMSGALGLLWLALACGVEQPLRPLEALAGLGAKTGPAATQATLQLGTGAGDFVALGEGENIRLILGPQGGYHLWAGARVTNMTPGRITLRFKIVDAAGSEISTTSYRRASEDGAGSWAGLPAFVAQPESVLGQDIRFSASASDEAGHTAQDERNLHVTQVEQVDRVENDLGANSVRAPVGEIVSFARDVVPIFDAAAYTCNACHHSDEHMHFGLAQLSLGTDQSGLLCNSLGTRWFPCADPIVAYRNLVGIQSRLVDMALVKPGDPDNSFLVRKLRGDHTSVPALDGMRVGRRMPMQIGMAEMMRATFYGPLDGVEDLMDEMGGMANPEGNGTNQRIQPTDLETITQWVAQGAHYN